MTLIFDLLLGFALVWSAGRTLATPDTARAVVLFIVFGLLMALAWARLDAPDIALAEAAIGAGLTGALLLDAVGAVGTGPGRGHDRITPLLAPAAVGLAATALAAALVAAMLELPAPGRVVPEAVAASLDHSGVLHPVTAVLLNFRGYDTLLEVAVLLLAVLGVLAVGGAGAVRRAGPGEPVLQTMARLLVPLMILAAGYLLWAGAHRPGGAFQAAAVLAAAAALLHLAGLLPAWTRPGVLLRLGLAGGFVIFLLVAAAMLADGELLRYPRAGAKALILLIEVGLTVSLGLSLAGLFLFLAGQGNSRR